MTQSDIKREIFGFIVLSEHEWLKAARYRIVTCEDSERTVRSNGVEIESCRFINFYSRSSTQYRERAEERPEEFEEKLSYYQF